jgi:hypothetical protein
LDEFGYFEIAWLFVTGSFSKIHEYHSIYDHVIITEMKKEFKRLIREKAYRTKVDLLITSSQQPSSLACRHFCYDIFTKGELRVMADTTYMFNNTSEGVGIDMDIPSKRSLSFGDFGGIGLVIRGEELHDERVKINLGIKDSFRTFRTHWS